jgi:endonuclease-3
MATTTSKQKLMNQLFAAPGKGARAAAEPDLLPVLEQFVYAVLRENATREAADRAYAQLRDRFFDWNEVRVSSAREIADAFDGLLSEPETRAQRVIDFLQEVFETTFSFDLEPLQKKGVKLAAKTLSRYQASSEFAVSWVVQQSLGGHAIPLDSQSVRVLKRLGLIDPPGNSLEAARTSLEHQVPKSKGAQFVDAVSRIADSHCWDADPACPTCPLCNTCVTGAEAKAAAMPASKKPR